MRKPKSVLVVYEPQTYRGYPDGYKLHQVNIKTVARENITVFSSRNIPTIKFPYFDSIYDMHVAVMSLLKSNGFVPHCWPGEATNLFDIDFLDITKPSELKRYHF